MHEMRHPNVMPLYCSFVHGEQLWMIMPHVAGGSLYNIMQSNFPQASFPYNQASRSTIGRYRNSLERYVGADGTPGWLLIHGAAESISCNTSGRRHPPERIPALLICSCLCCTGPRGRDCGDGGAGRAAGA